jgi:hypothetical protein
MKATVTKNAGHPWDGRDGFDVLLIDTESSEELDAAVTVAKRKFWHVWIRGIREDTGRPGAGLYKPSGIESEWHDSPDKPYHHD